MQKINVVGISGSGKSTFSKQLASILNATYIELDFLFWGPDWTKPSDEIFFDKVEKKLTATQNWVLDGNYSRTTDLKWKYADTVIWLDYPIWLTTTRVTKRAIQRVWSQEELWPGTGNTESFKNMVTKDGIIWWSISRYHVRKKQYEQAFSSDDYLGVEFIRLRSPKEADQFIKDCIYSAKG
ncbi:MAG: adenylate kinase [Chloroflexota bacterium]